MWKTYLPKLKYDSLFRRLLIRALLTLFIALLVASIDEFVSVYSGVREVFDREMAQTTRVYEALLSVYVKQVDSADLDIDQLYRTWQKSYEAKALDPGGKRFRNFGRGVDFQLLTKEGRVLLKSAGAPKEPFLDKLASGFYNLPSYQRHGGRLFCYYNEETQHWMLMVRSLEQRDEIMFSVVIRTIQTVLVALALLLLFFPACTGWRVEVLTADAAGTG